MSKGSENPTRKKGVGSMGEKKMRHVPPGSVALRLPRFGADLASFAPLFCNVMPIYKLTKLCGSGGV